MAMTLTSVDKRSNHGKKSVSLTLKGTEHPATPLTYLRLVHQETGDYINAAWYYIYGPTKTYVRYRLIGARKGLYNIVMNNLGTLATLTGAFRVK